MYAGYILGAHQPKSWNVTQHWGLFLGLCQVMWLSIDEDTWGTKFLSSDPLDSDCAILRMLVSWDFLNPISLSPVELLPYHHTFFLSLWRLYLLFIFILFFLLMWLGDLLFRIHFSIHWSNCRPMYMNPSNYSLWWKICQAQGWPCSFKGRLLEVNPW